MKDIVNSSFASSTFSRKVVSSQKFSRIDVAEYAISK